MNCKYLNHIFRAVMRKFSKYMVESVFSKSISTSLFNEIDNCVKQIDLW